jgi:hypothetical protein
MVSEEACRDRHSRKTPDEPRSGPAAGGREAPHGARDGLGVRERPRRGSPAGSRASSHEIRTILVSLERDSCRSGRDEIIAPEDLLAGRRAGFCSFYAQSAGTGVLAKCGSLCCDPSGSLKLNRCLEIIPPARGMAPLAGAAVAFARGAVRLARGPVPLPRGADPPGRGAGPLRRGDGGVARGIGAPGRGGVPLARAAIPPGRGPAPLFGGAAALSAPSGHSSDP